LLWPVAVVSVTRIERHLEIVDHHNSCWTTPEHYFELFGQGQIFVPVSVKIKENRTTAQRAQSPVEQSTQNFSAVSPNYNDIVPSREWGSGETRKVGVRLDGIDG